MPPANPQLNQSLGAQNLTSLEAAIMSIANVIQNKTVRTTDANGWTKYDYGDHQTFRKRITFSQTIATAVVLTVSSTNLPVNMTSLGNNYLSYSYTATGNAGLLLIVFEGSSAATALNFTTATTDAVSRAYVGFIDLMITTP